MPQILLQSPDRAAAPFDLAEGETRLGRHPENEIVIDDESVSSRHAVVRLGPEGLTLEDLGSTNATRVNGFRIDAADLSPGDQIRFGDAQASLPDAPSRTGAPLLRLAPKDACLCCGGAENLQPASFWAARRTELRRVDIGKSVYLHDTCNFQAPVCSACAAREPRPRRMGQTLFMAILFIPLFVMLAVQGLVLVTKDSGGKTSSVTELAPLLIGVVVIIIGVFLFTKFRKKKPFPEGAALRKLMPILTENGYRVFGDGKTVPSAGGGFALSDSLDNGLLTPELRPARIRK